MRVVDTRTVALSVSHCARKGATLLLSVNKSKHHSSRQNCVAAWCENQNTLMGNLERFPHSIMFDPDVSGLTSMVTSIVGWRADITINPNQSRNRWLLTWHQSLSGSCGRNRRWGSGFEVKAAHSSNVGTNKATLSASEVSFSSSSVSSYGLHRRQTSPPVCSRNWSSFEGFNFWMENHVLYCLRSQAWEVVMNHPAPFSDHCMWAEFQPISILLAGFCRVLWFPP